MMIEAALLVVVAAWIVLKSLLLVGSVAVFVLILTKWWTVRM
jgi:hypothetical protein